MFTLISACSLIAVIVALARTHPDRGSDIVLCAATGICFVVYRACIAFGIQSDDAVQYVFLPADSWHKLSNIFMLIEYCSVIIFLAKIPKKKEGYFLAFGTAIVIILQEKDSFSYQYALFPLILNNLILYFSTALYDTVGTFNTEMVIHGALWYVISVIGFVFTFSETMDYYFLFDDLFMVSTAFSLFYSWQSYEVDTLNNKLTIGLTEVPSTLRNLAIALREKARNKRDEIKKQAQALVQKRERSRSKNCRKVVKKKRETIESETPIKKEESTGADIESNASTIDDTKDSIKQRSAKGLRDSDESGSDGEELNSFMQSELGGT